MPSPSASTQAYPARQAPSSLQSSTHAKPLRQVLPAGQSASCAQRALQDPPSQKRRQKVAGPPVHWSAVVQASPTRPGPAAGAHAPPTGSGQQA